MDTDSKVSHIMSITNVSPEIAQQFLSMTGGDVNEALALLVDTQASYNAAAGPSATPSMGGSGSGVVLAPAAGGGTGTPTPAVSNQSNTYKPTPRPQTKSGITSFSDIRTTNPDDEKRDAFYAGGEKSGIAILDPRDKKDDIMDKVFESAMKHGAVSKCDVPPDDKEKFSGVGYTLGSAVDTTKVVQNKPPTGLKTVILTFWKDCFTVDDGPPRAFTDPANRSFLDDVNRGVVPRELESLAGGADVNIELIKKNEPYTPPPKPKVVAFSGAGQTLGGENTKSGTKAVAKLISVDDSQPTTTIQIRLHDGGRLVIKCNHTHTVGDIRNHIEASKPTGGKPMELKTTFPTKVLDNDSLTIKDAGLLNATIAQRV
eukprot:TRINITY_DN6563_c0_g1_i1.p1 TRINITY_DN6563_c0_g1~~TRINITY_DN6563_c0_g1_i1.p1  ORF type:complete len:372 (-),score=98.65 TRINITY_DN6563_c0_g1_i1:149-1264(-)